MTENLVQNFRGEWVPSIPEPLCGLRKHCLACEKIPGIGTVPCRRKFWTKDAYRAHYALIHILGLATKKEPSRQSGDQRDDSEP